MKPSQLFGLSAFTIALLACAALAADAPAPADAAPAASATPSAAPVSAPAATTAATAPTSSADIPTPLKTGQVIDLWPEGVPGLKTDIPAETIMGTTYTSITNARMLVYPAAAGTANGTSIIFCAGGGYQHVNIGGGMQQWLNPQGVTVFILLYRCKEYGAPAPQQDVMRAVRLVRSHATEFGLNPNHIGVLGDSAGSHVAASAGTLFDDPIGKTGAELDKVSARPDFMILAFPVLTMEAPYAHGQSKEGLLGAKPAQAMIDQYSLEKHVTANTPPTFLIHTQGDTTVSEQNTLMFYQALIKAKVPTEMHLYFDGPHGSGTSADLGPTALWEKLCEEWMRWNGWLPPSPTSMMKVQVRPASAARGARGAPRGAAPAAATPPAAPPAESAAPVAAL